MIIFEFIRFLKISKLQKLTHIDAFWSFGFVFWPVECFAVVDDFLGGCVLRFLDTGPGAGVLLRAQLENHRKRFVMRRPLLTVQHILWLELIELRDFVDLKDFS